MNLNKLFQSFIVIISAFVLLLFVVHTTAFSGDGKHVVLQDDLSIVIPDIEYQGQMLGLEVTLCFMQGLIFEICNVREINTEFVDAINHYRDVGAPCSTGGLNPISWDADLATASRLHSEDMQVNNYFSHTGLDGSSPWERVGRTGFRGQPMGENIASGYGSAAGAVQGWINSPGHCTNIMNPRVTVMGYGAAGTLHTMITGVRR